MLPDLIFKILCILTVIHLNYKGEFWDLQVLLKLEQLKVLVLKIFKL